MKILVATDAWHPQVNGVVGTLIMMAEAAKGFGVEISFLTPQSFRTFALPSYPDLRLALPWPAQIAELIEAAGADSIHIATEGPIGLLVRRYCRKHGLPFTTSFHTRFPEYVSARSPIPESWVWTALRWFHRPSQAVMAATPALANELRLRGFRNVVLWPRGVDISQFHPRDVDLCLPEPVFLCVGRVAVEKNLDAFLDLDLPGTKLIVGDGPARAQLERNYPEAVFLGARESGALIYDVIPPLVMVMFPDSASADSSSMLRDHLSNSTDDKFKMVHGKRPCLRGTVASGQKLWFGSILPDVMASIDRLSRLRFGESVEV